MAPITRTDKNQHYDKNGNLISEDIVVVDVTAPTNAEALRSKADAALDANATFLAIGTPTAAQNAAQVQRLTKECSALIRLLLGRLEDTAGT